MKPLLTVLLLGGMLVGCKKADELQVVLPNDSRTDPSISVEDKPADVPEFKRVYTKRLDNRAVIQMEAHTFLGDRRWDATLEQPNRSHVWFEPDAIADKILDPLLVPKVQSAVAQIEALDKVFMRSNPDSFVDESGTRWKRMP